MKNKNETKKAEDLKNDTATNTPNDTTSSNDTATEPKRLKKVYLITEEDLENWQKARAKISKEKIKKSDKLKYTLTVYFGSVNVYQEFFINEQQFNLVVENHKLNPNYSVHDTKVNIRLSKGIGNLTGEVFTIIDIVAVPKAVFIGDEHLKPETQYKVLQMDSVRWETLNRVIDEDSIDFGYGLE